MDVIAEYEFDGEEAQILSAFCSDWLTEEEMARKLILDAIDPIVALGPPYRFPQRPSDELFIGEVPRPYLQVDLLKAWSATEKDATACRLVLEHDDSTEALLAVYKNSIRWMAFWAVRCPNAEYRLKFEEQLQKLSEGLEALKRTAKLRLEIEIVQELESI
jgi:hypothetical protein